jgi:hypothetical protein
MNNVFYELTVTRRVENQDAQSLRFSSYGEKEQQFIEQRAMSVTLTEAEYEVVKQALITHWASPAYVVVPA